MSRKAKKPGYPWPRPIRPDYKFERGRDARLWQKAERAAAAAAAVEDQDGAAGQPRVLVGVSQHPYSKCWQIWLSLSGRDVTALTAHRQAVAAQVMLKLILTNLTDPQVLASPDPLSFLDTLKGDVMPLPFPPATLAEIGASIGRSAKDQRERDRDWEGRQVKAS